MGEKLQEAEQKQHNPLPTKDLKMQAKRCFLHLFEFDSPKSDSKMKNKRYETSFYI